MKKILVGILMGSDSDLPVMKKAVEVLREFDVSFELKVISAHRTPELLIEWCKSVNAKGIKVVIAAAGGAAHLPGVVASYLTLPVIGVPISSKNFSSLDSLLSIVQMPAGIPVATVAIDGAKNAAILAIQMLALDNAKLADNLLLFKKKIAEESIKKNDGLEY